MLKQLINQFVDKEVINERKGKRRYLHFDSRLKLSKKIIAYVTKPHNIVRHSFYPFLRFIKKTKKYKREDKLTVTFKERDICFASHIDSFIYSWYCVILESKYENIIRKGELNCSILAYRKINVEGNAGNNIYFAKEVFDFIRENENVDVIT